MKKSYLILIAVLGGIITVMLLYIRISKINQHTSQPIQNVTPIPTVQKVEFFIDRNIPLNQLSNSTSMSINYSTQSAVAESNSIGDKYDQNYPYNSIFPYRTSSFSVTYRLEPKKLYVVSTLDDVAASSSLDSYLKTHNLKLGDLFEKGVTVIFEQEEASQNPLSRE